MDAAAHVNLAVQTEAAGEIRLQRPERLPGGPDFWDQPLPAAPFHDPGEAPPRDIPEMRLCPEVGELRSGYAGKTPRPILRPAEEEAAARQRLWPMEVEPEQLPGQVGRAG